MKKILIADDSPSIRRLLETILRSAGYTVLSAADGREALKLAFEEPIDAVVADEEMPNLSGSSLFKILKMDPERKSVPRIMISGLTASGEEPVSEFADIFVSKNTDLKTHLLEALDQLL